MTVTMLEATGKACDCPLRFATLIRVMKNNQSQCSMKQSITEEEWEAVRTQMSISPHLGGREMQESFLHEVEKNMGAW